MTLEVERYLAVGAALFVLGALGFLTRRNLILMVLSAEMMLHGVSLTLVTFGRVHHSLEGQAFTIFILTVAACEAAIALAVVLSLFHKSGKLDITVWQNLREDNQAAFVDRDISATIPKPETRWPKLTPAGIEPDHDLEEVTHRSHL